jgi:replication factor A2
MNYGKFTFFWARRSSLRSSCYARLVEFSYLTDCDLSGIGMDYQGGSGGGFGVGGGGEFSSPPNSASGRPRRSNDEQTIQPVTVAMIMNATPLESDKIFQLQDGRKVYHVKLVGAVRSFVDQSTNCLYEIEDGTGLLEVKQWTDANAECSALTELREQTQRENIYVRIVGTIQEYNGRKTVLADSVRPLTTGNELTHHVLDVVYAGERAHQQKSGIGFMAGFGVPAASTRGPAIQTSVSGGVRDAVIAFIKTNGDPTEEGANVLQCIQQLNYPEHEIRKVIDELSAEGHIYSTIDENNYKFAM